MAVFPVGSFPLIFSGLMLAVQRREGLQAMANRVSGRAHASWASLWSEWEGGQLFLGDV